MAGEVARLRALLDQMRPPVGPVIDRWSMGFGDVLTGRPATPSPLRGIDGKLDRYGGLGITEQGVSIDGTEVSWSAVA
ncbi:hypothetical protein [Mycolicibacterium tusciae]|uniref:hypothetical protein n=1 Tax=Mycolicibacterium tusciae TaxID=75922 RepID=UPI000301A9AC|nr:hypothetical protein [Mycolicibacterium tusciae]